MEGDLTLKLYTILRTNIQNLNNFRKLGTDKKIPSTYNNHKIKINNLFHSNIQNIVLYVLSTSHIYILPAWFDIIITLIDKPKILYSSV